ncbi:MAG: hypothetical protein L0Z53_21060, partial [Acidobacteriales bacterium]|nr:hypothetical protein [Terriglobales bacterium]
ALAENVCLTTVVADDGQAMTEMALSVRNNGKQHLEIELPTRSSVWSAFVGGNPARPRKVGDKLLLPLDAFAASEAAVPVEITFSGAFAFPKRKGDVAMASPKLDVPVKNARWDVYLPPDYDYAEFGGSMAHEQEIVPVLQLYSSSEYARQEQEKMIARKSELRGYLGNVRKGLSEGKLKSAAEELSQAIRLNSNVDGDAQRELEGLQKELGKVQSSNLLQAQRSYASENRARFGVDDRFAQKPQSEVLLRQEEEAAEQQWRALQRAQAVSATQVQPLRVNLPTRGLRHSFTQVLQTEVQKPLTIQFEARSTETVGWFKRALWSIAGFAALWIFVAILDARRRGRTQMATV